MIRKSEIPVSWFVCPETKSPLIPRGDDLGSASGIYQKDRQWGFWNFIPSELKIFNKTRWDAWNTLQKNATIPYTEYAEQNLGVGPREDFLLFAEFCGFRGNVLDIGVGPQKCPTHIQYSNTPDVFFVGIDTLVGQQPRDFAFAQALGEYLPFNLEIFDQVLFVTSLDHFIEPIVAMREARRVLKPAGDMIIWLGEKDKNAPKHAKSPDWYRSLEIPEGAEDPFHFKRISISEFKQLACAAEMNIVDEAIHPVDEWRKNCFYRLKKM